MSSACSSFLPASKCFSPESEWSSRKKIPCCGSRENCFRVTPDFVDGQKFFTRLDGRFALTPLALVLLLVETTDLIFAVDSVPAVFSVTRKAFIVFTSNVFAILGLRSLYFLLAGAIGYFRYLKIGLSVVLVFIGAKMLLEPHDQPTAMVSNGNPHRRFAAGRGGDLLMSIVLSVIAARVKNAIALPRRREKRSTGHRSVNMKFRWSLAPPQPLLAGQLAAQLKISPLLAQCLLNRGFSEPPAIENFLAAAPEKSGRPVSAAEHGRGRRTIVPRPRTERAAA